MMGVWKASFLLTCNLLCALLHVSAFQIPTKSIVAKKPAIHTASPLRMGQESHQDDLWKKMPPLFQKRARNSLMAGLALSFATFFGSPQATLAEDVMMNTAATPVASQTTANVKASLSARRYWNIMASTEEGADQMRIQANERLMDYAVGTVNTMYYDNTGGAKFNQRDFYDRWRALRDEARAAASSDGAYHKDAATPSLNTREGVVHNLKWIISTLNDPYSKYLTREEMWQELNGRNDGFLGTGAIVEPPELGEQFFARGYSPTLATVLPDDASPTSSDSKKKDGPIYHSAGVVQNLPVVTAVTPDSPAERSGITVGDRIVAVGEYSFLGQSKQEVSRNFQSRFASSSNYFGHSDVTFAKPVLRTLLAAGNSEEEVQRSTSAEASSTEEGSSRLLASSNNKYKEREVVIGYRQTRVRLPTMSLEEEQYTANKSEADPVTQQPETLIASTNLEGMLPPSVDPSAPPTKGGNSIVHWELLSEGDSSIFQKSLATEAGGPPLKVGYIRLTRFSKASTAGYVAAVEALERAGATSYIIDLRNNYGGIIQEAMLTASTLLRDPHAVLCYTMNARGGFTPHDVEEYVVDKRYPGYMLSKEPRWVTLLQSQRENPVLYEDGGSHWVPPSSYVSLHQQIATRGLHRPSSLTYTSDWGNAGTALPYSRLQWYGAAASKDHNQQLLAQRNLVVLINEGTASSAEVFASALHDNGRTLALVGSKSYGKGLVQHTFPMPDGGGLRLTVAEYLTPALRHVTVVGNAKYDPVTGDQVGGGIKPDVYCASKQGIPSNVGADLCVGMALDVLQEAEPSPYTSQGQEKHSRQQRMKLKQEQQDLLKHGILAKTNKANTGSRLSTTASSSSSIVAQEEDARVDSKVQDDF